MNSRLLNISTVIVAVLTISVGFYVYNSSQSIVTDSLMSVENQVDDELTVSNNVDLDSLTTFDGTENNAFTSLNEIENNSSTSVSNQVDPEVKKFNEQFASYEGEQSGAMVKALMGTLIINADTIKFSDEPEIAKIPQVYIDKANNTRQDEIEAVFTSKDSWDDIDDYTTQLGQIRNKSETEHTYNVEFTYQDNGLIDYIIISYDIENLADALYRD